MSHVPELWLSAVALINESRKAFSTPQTTLSNQGVPENNPPPISPHKSNISIISASLSVWFPTCVFGRNQFACISHLGALLPLFSHSNFHSNALGSRPCGNSASTSNFNSNRMSFISSYIQHPGCEWVLGNRRFLCSFLLSRQIVFNSRHSWHSVIV